MACIVDLPFHTEQSIYVLALGNYSNKQLSSDLNGK